VKALHQSCVSHMVRRCRDLAEIVSATAAALPLAVLGLLEKALALRDRYQADAISLHGQWTAAGRIEAQLDRLLDKPYQTEANRRLAKHLDHEFPYLFTFLHCPGMEATDNRAERAIRPAVMARHLRHAGRLLSKSAVQGFGFAAEFLIAAPWAETISPAYAVVCPESAVLAGKH